MKRHLLQLLIFFLLGGSAHAFEIVKVSDRVYALVGDLGQRSADNLGHNMTSGFIVGDDGVAVVDPGACHTDAAAIDAAIRKVTDKPVRWVVNTGGQDHRWLANGYFKTQDVHIVAAAATREFMEANAETQQRKIQELVGDKCGGSDPVYPDVTFADSYRLPIHGVAVELRFTGGAHTPGDLFVWLPESKILFSGDAVYVERLLGIFPNGLRRWIVSLELIRDSLKPDIIIPGHGRVTNLEEAMRDTYGYLTMLRDKISARIADGAFDPVEAAEGLDQSEFAYLKNYDQLSFRAMNALRAAEELFRFEE
ncbi:MAG: MBL fold metallo-hydrolase [Candidatus Thiodiazotropha sp. (ex Epidulcina cf. delphinae)]|nr:MBL fold metallo-hydrolase [Candidatus Thiodiazotropha sp. (ex Epidulcina cf. delphinae)]